MQYTLYKLTDLEEYAENQRKLGKVEGQLEVLNPLLETKLRVGSTERAHEYRENPKHINKQYNLMRLLTGSGPMIPDDTPSSTDSVRYYGGSSNANVRTDSDKVRKSYELMRHITRS